MATAAFAIAGLAVSGIMSYQSSQAQAKAASQAALMHQQQAAAQMRLAALQAQQLQSQKASDEIVATQERVSLRKAAWAEQQNAIAQAAARGTVAVPWGSFGAILDESADNLYEDLEANRTEQLYKSTMYALELEGIWQSAASNSQIAMMQAKMAKDEARGHRQGALLGAVGAAFNAYTIWGQ